MPTKHFLSPQASVLSEPQALALLSKYGVHKEQLPLIRPDDASLRELGAKPGDIIQFLRFSPVTSQPEAYYRVVAGTEG